MIRNVSVRPSAPPSRTVLLLAVALTLAVAGAANAQTMYTPLEWQPKLGDKWTHDANNNNVDDWIETLRPDTTINLALALNDCPSAQDLSRFGTYGTIGYRSKFISVVQLLGVTAAHAVALGADARVAEVFPDLLATAFLDVSVPAMGVTASATYSPLTIADKYPGTTGANVGIVIMDSGVDDVQHVTFAGGRYVGGYDFANDIPGNPDDQQGHGSHVAGIALGSALPYRGVAPSAKLIDMRVMTVGGFPIMRAVRAIDSCIVQRKAWNIRVLNASFGMDQYPDGSDAPSNGLDPLSQAFDAAVRAGIVVVAAAGNSGHALIGWGPASSEAITVAASDDRSTVSRNDDVIAAFSSRGPRQDNQNGIASDEQKPDITAPGTAVSINTPGIGIASAAFNTPNAWTRKQGTSMAAPHVAGLAALLIQKRPDLTPRQLKQLLIRTAIDKGAAGWDVSFGWGLADGFAAMDAMMNGVANVGFQEYVNFAAVWWESNSVKPANSKIVAGVPNKIVSTIHNSGPAFAENVHVKVGVYNYGNDMTMYPLADVVIRHLDAAADTVIETDWTPGYSGPAPGTMHACLKAEIVYGPDTFTDDNFAQHNVEIQSAPQNTLRGGGDANALSALTTQQMFTPIQYTMQIVNPTTELLSVDFHDVAGELAGSGWKLTQSSYGELLAPGDCPFQLTLTLTPSDTAHAQVRCAIAVTGYQMAGGSYALGGASIVGQADHTLAVAEAGGAPVRFVLAPNPSRGPVAVGFALERSDRVSVRVFDITGRRVRTLAEGRLEAGAHRFTWDGRDDGGRALANGVYWVRLSTSRSTETRTLMRVN